jgi:hypothetical protein
MNHRQGTADNASGGLTRRHFIAAALSLAAGGLSGALAEPAAAPGTKSDRRQAASTDLLRVLADPAAAARFGRAYLAAHPAEADLDLLIDQLRAAVSNRHGSVPTDADALTSALVAVVEQEYATLPPGRVDGWLLAPSEARLYALAALASGPSGA